MVAVLGVPVTVVDVVDVVTVRHGDVTAALPVVVVVAAAVLGMPGALAFVGVIGVHAVQVTVVHVVDVVTVRDGDVAAARPVRVVVIGVRVMLGVRHWTRLPTVGQFHCRR